MKPIKSCRFPGISGWIAALMVCAAAMAKELGPAVGSSIMNATVYKKASDAPAPTSTPQKVLLRTPSSVTNKIRVLTLLSDIRLNRSVSSGLSFSGAEVEFRRFVRFELDGLGGLERPLKLAAKYTVKEGKASSPHVESAMIREDAPSVVVDLVGVVDVVGSSVKTSSYSSMTSATKSFHSTSKIISVDVMVSDNAGKVLFFGGWPDEPGQDKAAMFKSVLPTETRSWTYYSRPLVASLVGVEGSMVRLRTSAGKEMTVSLSALSESDRDYLNGQKQAEGKVPAVTARKPRSDTRPDTRTDIGSDPKPEAKPEAKPNELHTWTDSTGQHRTVATFISLDRANQKVNLRLEDGVSRSIPLKSLSMEDRHLALLSHLPDLQKGAAKLAIQSDMSYFIWSDGAPGEQVQGNGLGSLQSQNVTFHFFALKEPERALHPPLAPSSRGGGQAQAKMNRELLKDIGATESVMLPGDKEKTVMQVINFQRKVCGSATAYFLGARRYETVVQLFRMSPDQQCLKASNALSSRPSFRP